MKLEMEIRKSTKEGGETDGNWKRKERVKWNVGKEKNREKV